MSVQEMIQEAEKLTIQERQQLIQALEAMSTQDKTYKLSDLRGLGAEIWRDVDVDAYINQLRDEWDNR